MSAIFFCTRNCHQTPGNPFNMINPKSSLLPLQALARSFGSTSHQHLPPTAAGLPGAVAVPIGRFLPPSAPPQILDPVSTGQLLGLLKRGKTGLALATGFGVRLGREMAGFERKIDVFSEVFLFPDSKQGSYDVLYSLMFHAYMI